MDCQAKHFGCQLTYVLQNFLPYISELMRQVQKLFTVEKH